MVIYVDKPYLYGRAILAALLFSIEERLAAAILITIFVLISYNEDVRYAERVSASSIMPQTSLRRGWVVAADDLQPLFCLLAHEVVLQDIAFRTQSPHLSHL